MPGARERSCYICRHPSGRRKYCARHDRMMKQVHAEFVAHREALRRTWNDKAGGHLCEYVHVLLGETDIKSPLYRSYDHEVPGVGPIRLTFSRLNMSKKDLSWSEMRTALGLMESRFLGKPFDKSAMRFRYYVRLVPAEDIGLLPGSADPVGGYVVVAGQRINPCEICESPAPAKGKYCARCNRFILHHEDKAERAAALKRAWDRKRKRFRCYITGVLLEETDFRDPWYIVFDHVVPDGTRLEVCAAWVNGMKADMTLEGFRAFVAEIRKHLRTGEEFDVTVLGI
jgi:hypothetical protein